MDPATPKRKAEEFTLDVFSYPSPKIFACPEHPGIQSAQRIFSTMQGKQWVASPLYLKAELLPQVLGLIETSGGRSFDRVNRICVDILIHTIRRLSNDLKTTAELYNAFWRTGNPLFLEVKETTAINFLRYVEKNPKAFTQEAYNHEAFTFTIDESTYFESAGLFSLLLFWIQNETKTIPDYITVNRNNPLLICRMKLSAAFRNREYHQALIHINEYLERIPDDQEFLRIRCQLLLRLEHPQTLKCAEALVTLYENFENLKLLGNIQWRLKSHKSAAKTFEKAIKLKPEDPDCYLALAYMHLTAKNFEMVRFYLEKALKSNPLHLLTHTLNVRLKSEETVLNELSTAILQLEKCPNSEATGLLYRGRFKLLTGNNDHARICFEKGLEIDWNNPRLYLGLAEVAMREKNYAKAHANIDLALSNIHTRRLPFAQGEDLTEANVFWFEIPYILAEIQYLKKLVDQEQAKYNKSLEDAKIKEKQAANVIDVRNYKRTDDLFGLELQILESMGYQFIKSTPTAAKPPAKPAK